MPPRGEHTDDVLGRLAGLDRQRIEALVDSGVMARAGLSDDLDRVRYVVIRGSRPLKGNGGAVQFWVAIGICYAVLALLLVALSVPSPFLFAGVLAGAAGALLAQQPRPFPEFLRSLGVTVIGSAAGSSIDPDVVETLASRPVVVIGGVIGTLAISLLAGQVLRWSPHVDGPTAIFASIAGGASGVSAMAREMDADERIVLTIQYLRVLLVLASVPVVSHVLGAEADAGAHQQDSGVTPSSIGFTAVVIVVGLTLSRLIRFSASRLILPMLLATGLSLAGVFPDSTVPAAVLDVGYAATGLMVGVAFTRPTARLLVRIMPLALLQSVLALAGCGLVGLALSRATGMAALDGYLATTPGGLPAVTAIAIGSGASVGLVITMQLVRLFLALLLAPVIGAVIRRRRRR